MNYYDGCIIPIFIQIFVSKSKSDYVGSKRDYYMLIDIFGWLKSLDIQLSKMLRFILLHNIKTEVQNVENHDLLFYKTMMYKSNRETPLCTYLAHLLPKLTISDEVVVNGLYEFSLSGTPKEIMDKLHLDSYYLIYMSEHVRE